MSGRVTLDDFNAVPAPSVPAEWDGELAQLLEETRTFFRRFIVVGEPEAVAVSLWVAHTYVFATSRATPYLYLWSPEFGSGKTTALEVLEVVTHKGLTADDLSGAALFRLIQERHPALLLDEVDGVFRKKGSEAAEDHRKILNSGYRAGKRVFRCGGKNNTELQEFDVYCPKALAGLNEIPGTLAHRAIPISMKPPRPGDTYADFDREEAEAAASYLRGSFELWAAAAEADLRDPRRKPAKLPELDARRNEIWRILFRIADLADGRWPEAARAAALELSAGERRNDEASLGVRLLADVRELLLEEKMTCKALVKELNERDDSPWGGWKDGAGLTTRLLGWKLKPYGIRARKLRIGDETHNGYEREQFEDAWSRYLPNSEIQTGTTGTSGFQSQNTAKTEPEHRPSVPVLKTAANPHEQEDVPVVPVEIPEYGAGEVDEEEVERLAELARQEVNGARGTPFPGDEWYPLFIAEAGNKGHITEDEFSVLYARHKFLERARVSRA